MHPFKISVFNLGGRVSVFGLSSFVTEFNIKNAVVFENLSLFNT